MEDDTTKRDKKQDVYKEGVERRVSLPGGEILVNARAKALRTCYFNRIKVYGGNVQGRCLNISYGLPLLSTNRIVMHSDGVRQAER